MEEPENSPLKAITVIKFLFGNPSAIREIATNRSAFWLGFIFVLAAGFAREYDNEDLLHEPWYLLIPLVASVGSSLLLYYIIRAIARNRGDEIIAFLVGYRSFLTLYWMTAPLAWFYATPYEQFLPASDSVSANLWTLFFVAFWRVLLITRVVSVLYQSKWISSFFVVMFFADGLAMAILYFTPLPIFNIMGGTHLSQSESIILGLAINVGILGWLSLPIWTIGTLIIKLRKKEDESKPIPWRLQIRTQETNRITLSLKTIAIFSLLFWVPVLPFTQPQQQNRRHAEKLLQSGQIKEGLDFLSSLNQDDFPKHWTPPPRLGYYKSAPPLTKVTDELLRKDRAQWVTNAYLENIVIHSYSLLRAFPLDELDHQQSDHFIHWMENNPELPALIDFNDMDNRQLNKFANWMESSPEHGKIIAIMLKDKLNQQISYYADKSPGSYGAERFKPLKRMQKLIPKED